MSAAPTTAVLTAALSGAGVMTLEILASRWLAPAFGETLTTWAVLISLTLLGGSVGSWLGGAWSRRTSPPRVAALLLVATVWLAAAGLAAPLLVGGLDDLPLLAGSIVAAAAILLPPVIALGAVIPQLLATLAGEREAGRAAGLLLAVSTAGSLAGTLVPALWLVPSVGARATALLAAGVLGLGAAAGLGVRARAAAGAFAAVCAFLAAMPAGPGEGRIVRESLHGTVELVRHGPRVDLLVDGILQGTESPLSMGPGSLLRRGQLVELLPWLHPQGRRALVIGLGSGRYARGLEAYGIQVRSVDVNPVLVEIVRERLGFDGPVEIADGRAALRRKRAPSEFVVLDAFRGEAPPSHLLTREAFAEAREALAPGGILLVHLIGRPGHPVTGSVARTLGAVFPEVLCTRSGAGDEMQDLFLFASDRNLRLLPHPDLAAAGITGGEVFAPSPSGAVLLTDDRNPIARLNEPLARELRRASRALRLR